MEVAIPPAMEFDFSSANPSPYLSAPSTPKRFGEYYFSTPASPKRLDDFDDFFVESNDSAAQSNGRHEDDFAFNVGGESEETSTPAEDLFDDGKIRSIKPSPPPRPEASKSPVRKMLSRNSKGEGNQKRGERERGRERVQSLSSSNSGRRAARSLSPYRVSKYPWEEEQQPQHSTKQSSIIPKPSKCRKWKLKDFFLFRSASEGRASDKDPLKKYTAIFKKFEDVKSSSFRSIEGSNSGSSSRKRGPVSAHELHYTVNRAVSEDLKKKTFLPYKQGILGRLAFNPAVHALANGFGFSHR